jgi:L-glutamine-phosphate cytidylyltransferase
MAKVRAAVLAAGRGVRMGGHTPKTLIPLGNREPLLWYILDGLKRSGMEDVLIVTGFRPGAVQEFVEERIEGMEITYVFNARYASWGNFHSVRMAVDQSPGMDLLVVNSDIVVSPDVFTRTSAASGELVLAVQKRPNLDAEDMRVELEGERVKQIGKDVTMVRSHGEFSGVSLLRPFAARLYQDIASDLEWKAETSGYYEDIYAGILRETDAHAAPVEEGEYAEVDEPEDVEAALAVVDRHWERDRENGQSQAESRPA